MPCLGATWCCNRSHKCLATVRCTTCARIPVRLNSAHASYNAQAPSAESGPPSLPEHGPELAGRILGEHLHGHIPSDVNAKAADREEVAQAAMETDGLHADRADAHAVVEVEGLGCPHGLACHPRDRGAKLRNDHLCWSTSDRDLAR